ncbi:MAG: hypothetical protein ACTS77_02395 [Arsenophonus sp. NC-TX2-MAG3]
MIFFGIQLEILDKYNENIFSKPLNISALIDDNVNLNKPIDATTTVTQVSYEEKTSNLSETLIISVIKIDMEVDKSIAFKSVKSQKSQIKKRISPEFSRPNSYSFTNMM